MSLDKFFRRNFIEYASYVIKDRAIPELSDGLKPVQRRILHTLYEVDDGKFNKVANVVGHAMRYHPHGDASIGSALISLANRDYFIERQGNFGNIYTGDDASAPRYIECRLTRLAKEVLFNPDITEMTDSYDSRSKEPVTLPSKIPTLLLLGAEGIAVGMSTKILPHNFRELLEAEIAILRNEPFQVLPDFPQGGLLDPTGYEEGNGRIRVRAKMAPAGSKSVRITEIPFSTTTESLIRSVEDAARKGKIKVAQINDYTSDKVEIEIVPARGVSARDLIPALYAFTDCEVSISVNLIVIQYNKPRQMTVPEVLKHNAVKLRDDLKLELGIRLDRELENLHRRTLVQIFIEQRVYKLIEEQTSFEAVKRAVYKGLQPFRKELKRNITDEDIETLLEIPIKRISKFDLEKSRKDIKDTKQKIEAIRTDLKDITGTAIRFLEDLLERYGDRYPRRTTVTSFDTVDVRDVDMEVVKIRYDAKTGYLGEEVREGRLLSLSAYAKLHVVRRDGTYSIIPVPDKKMFVGENLPHLEIHVPKVVFNVIYKDKETKQSYVKRFRVEKFIQNREYRYFGEKGTLQAFSLGDVFRVKVKYKKKPRLKVLEEEVDFSELAVKSVGARGNRVSAKEISSVKILPAAPAANATKDKSGNSTPLF